MLVYGEAMKIHQPKKGSALADALSVNAPTSVSRNRNRSDEASAMQNLYRAIALAVQRKWPSENWSFEANGGSYLVAYKPGEGIGQIHFDHERGQRGQVVVCVDRPESGEGICKCTRTLGCRFKPHGRTLLNLSNDGATATYYGLKHRPVGVDLRPGDVVVVRNFITGTDGRPNKTTMGWHTGEAVLCGRKVIISIGLYSSHRCNNFDVPGEWHESVLCTEERQRLLAHAKDSGVHPAEGGLPWATDEAAWVGNRLFKDADDYNAHSGRPRFSLLSFTKSRELKL